MTIQLYYYEAFTAAWPQFKGRRESFFQHLEAWPLHNIDRSSKRNILSMIFNCFISHLFLYALCYMLHGPAWWDKVEADEAGVHHDELLNSSPNAPHRHAPMETDKHLDTNTKIRTSQGSILLTYELHASRNTYMQVVVTSPLYLRTFWAVLILLRAEHLSST